MLARQPRVADFAVLQRTDLIAEYLELGLRFVEDLAVPADAWIKHIPQWNNDPCRGKRESGRKLNLTVCSGATAGLLNDRGVGDAVKADDHVDIVPVVDLLFDPALSRRKQSLL